MSRGSFSAQPIPTYLFRGPKQFENVDVLVCVALGQLLRAVEVVAGRQLL